MCSNLWAGVIVDAVLLKVGLHFREQLWVVGFGSFRELLLDSLLVD